MSTAPELDVIVPKVDPMQERAQKAQDDPRRGKTLEFHVCSVGGLQFNASNLKDADEFSVVVGSVHWNLTLDHEGRSWLDMTPDEQRARWNEVKFRKGPRPKAYKRKLDTLEALDAASNGGRKRVNVSRTTRAQPGYTSTEATPDPTGVRHPDHIES